MTLQKGIYNKSKSVGNLILKKEKKLKTPKIKWNIDLPEPKKERQSPIIHKNTCNHKAESLI